jgi:hypothetical protein
MNMRRILKRPIALLLFLSWLPIAVTLFPFPTYRATEEIVWNQLQDLEKEGKTFHGDVLSEKQTQEELAPFHNPEFVRAEARAMWSLMLRAWLKHCAVLVVGLSACVIALFRLRFWQLALFASSLFYFALSVSLAWVNPPLRLVPTPENVWLWLMIVTRISGAHAFVYRDFVLPYIQAAVIVTLSVNALLSIRRRSQEEQGRQAGS